MSLTIGRPKIGQEEKSVSDVGGIGSSATWQAPVAAAQFRRSPSGLISDDMAESRQASVKKAAWHVFVSHLDQPALCICCPVIYSCA
jgi:hypothetical protein